MEEINKLKVEIVERYNMTWMEAHLTDNIGIIELAKENFKNLVDELVVKTYEKGMNVKN